MCHHKTNINARACVCKLHLGTFSSVTVCLEKSLSIYVCLPFFISTSNVMWEFFLSLQPHALTQLFLPPPPPSPILRQLFLFFRKFKHWSKFVIATRLQLNIIHDPIFQVRQASLGKWIKAIWKVFFFSFRCSVMFKCESVCVRVCCCCIFFCLTRNTNQEILMLVGWLGWGLFFGYFICTAMFCCQTIHQ